MFAAVLRFQIIKKYICWEYIKQRMSSWPKMCLETIVGKYENPVFLSFLCYESCKVAALIFRTPIQVWFFSCSHTFLLYVRIPFRSPEPLQMQRANPETKTIAETNGWLFVGGFYIGSLEYCRDYFCGSLSECKHVRGSIKVPDDKKYICWEHIKQCMSSWSKCVWKQ